MRRLPSGTRLRISRALAFCAALVLVLVCAQAWARPGGGSGFSGGSSGGSGGGGGGGDSSGLVGFLIALCIQHPVIGIPLLLIFVVYTLVQKSRRKGGNWEAGVSPTRAVQAWQPMNAAQMQPNVRAAAVVGARRGLERLRESDPNFSVVLLEDFLYALYTEVHTARGRGDVARFAAYLSPPVVAGLSQARVEVRDIIVGAMHFRPAPLRSGDPQDYVVAEFETNYTEIATQAKPQSYYVVERWTLSRRRGALSRTPDRARVFGCPSCGAPQDAVMSGTCSHCQKVVSTGDFDWVVRNIEILQRDPRPPVLTGDAPERGNELPTLFDPHVESQLADVQTRDPQFSVPMLFGRLRLIFDTFQVAWSARDLAGMRPFLSDYLWSAQAYWIETYKRQQLRNVTQNTRILDARVVRVTSDRFYDAVTIRLFASGLDFTQRDDGHLVSGSRSKERKYSEYWTLIRGRNRKGPTRTTPECPNCGAALKINMVGVCEYCSVKVTTGDFDWVLSRIEQDEAYDG